MGFFPFLLLSYLYFHLKSSPFRLCYNIAPKKEHSLTAFLKYSYVARNPTNRKLAHFIRDDDVIICDIIYRGLEFGATNGEGDYVILLLLLYYCSSPSLSTIKHSQYVDLGFSHCFRIKDLCFFANYQNIKVICVF